MSNLVGNPQDLFSRVAGHFFFCQFFRQDRLSSQPSKYETVSKKGPKMALGGSDVKLVFRKRVYRHVHDIPNDPVEYHLLYAEAVNKVVKVGQNN